MDRPFLPFARFALPVIAAASILARPVFAEAPAPIKILDLGQERTFLVSEREVFVIHRRGAVPGDLRRRIESGVPGATVLSETPTRALLRLPTPVVLADAAARKDAVSKALPEVEVLPVAYAAGSNPNENARRYITREVLVALPPEETIEQLASSVGALSKRTTIKAGFYILTFATPYKGIDAVRALRLRGVDAQPLVQYTMAKRQVVIPNDQFFSSQWHLINTGQNGGVPGVDANVLGAWQTTLGAGTTISIVDDCVQTLHPDLTENCPALSTNLHHDFLDDDNDPRPGTISDMHGTACAGVAAARQNNGIPDPNTGALLGVTGAAPEARLLGIRLISGPFTDEDAAGALFWHPGNTIVDISSNSWGPPDGAFGLAAPDILTREAMRKAAEEGRNGLGQVTLFAAGNGLGYSDDSNADGLANSRYVLAVGALGHRGTQAVYSEPGANILVTAPSQGDFGSIAITTTDVTGVNGYNPQLRNPATSPNLPNTDYTNTFNGTSSACPLVAGCVSLILGANPLLGWRDVKEIVASTATMVDVGDFNWRFNGAGFKMNHKYGGGMINASAAVARALTWTNLPIEAEQTRTLVSGPGGAVPANIPDTLGAQPLRRSFDFSAQPNIRVEQIEVIVNISHPHRSDLNVDIISPSGTRSNLATLHPFPLVGSLDTDVDFKDYVLDFGTYRNTKGTQGWTFTTVQSWGENSRGIWTLEIRDARSGSAGTLNAATLNLFGTAGPNGTPAPEGRIVIEQARYTTTELPTEDPMTQVTSPRTVTLRVRRVGPRTAEAFIDYTTTPGTAHETDDFTPVTGTLHFAPDAEFADTDITVTITDDNGNPGGGEAERTESFFVALTNPVGGMLGGITLATVDIFDDEVNEVTIVSDDPECRETDEGLPTDLGSFTISRLTALSTPLTVRFGLSGTAKMGSTPDSDYNTISQVVTIPAFENSVSVTVTPRNDQVMEGSETIIAKLTPDAGYTIGLADTATTNLRDNDLPQVELFATDTFLRENPTDTGTVRIQRRDGNGQALVTTTPLQIFLQYSGSQIPPTEPNPDYTVTANGNPVTNTVEIPAGSDHVDLLITPLNDDVYQATKRIIIELLVNPEYNFAFGFFSKTDLNVIEDEAVPETKIPTVTIAQPKSKQAFTAPAPVMASGVATDNVQVKRVNYRLNNGTWQIANFNPAATGTWDADLTPDIVRGPNRLEVQAVDSVDNLSKIATIDLKYVETKNLTVNIVGTGTVTTGFVGTTTREVGQTYTIQATPGANDVFNGWTDVVTSNQRTISFVMPGADATLTANFIANPFTANIAGNYSGLVEAIPFTNETSGYVKLTVTTKGSFTGTLTLGGIAYALKGEFTGNGDFTGAIPRKNDIPLFVTLHVDPAPNGTRRITGLINFGSSTATIVADRTAFDKTNPVPPALVKSYTLLFPPADPLGNPERDPRGFGVGTMKVDSAGMVSWSGTLADGSKASQKQPLAKDSVTGKISWPLFLSLYKKKGVMLGTVNMDTAPANSDLNALVDWLKPLNSKDVYFPSGFKIENANLIGSIYTPPPAGTRALNGFTDTADNGIVHLEEGSLFANLTHKLTLGADNKITITDPTDDKLKLTINATTGTFTGSFVHPVSLKNTTITGVLFQKQEMGMGFFPGTSVPGALLQTGRVTLDHVP